MIDYVEIRDYNGTLTGIVDTAKSIIWAAEYYGAGSFEIYAPLTLKYKAILKLDSLVTQNGKKNVGIIERLRYTYNAQDGRMIIASGRMLKSVLERKICGMTKSNYYYIGNPTTLAGNVAVAVQNLIKTYHDGDNWLKIDIAAGSNGGITKNITAAQSGESASRQSSYGNLLEFTDKVLKEYKCGSYVSLENGVKYYNCYEGKDHTVKSNDPVIFSQDYDNLISTEYTIDSTIYKNGAVIGGEGEGTSRMYANYPPITTNMPHNGKDNRYTFIDGSSISRKYTENGTEKSYTDTEYTAILQNFGAQELSNQQPTEIFSGEISLTHSAYKLGTDFDIGDMVTVHDRDMGLFADVRILKITEVQDDNGYILSAEYGNDEDEQEV